MSDTSASNHDLPTSELVGGKLAGILLAVLFLTALGVDVFLLDDLMGAQTPERYFADPCRVGIEGPAGGYALALVAVLGIALLGLHLFSKRSFMLSLVLMGLGILLQIYVIARHRALENFLAQDYPWYHNFPALGAVTGSCEGALLRDQVYARYQAVLDVAQPDGGVQETFTIMLQFNVMIGAVIAALIWSVGGVTWAIRTVGRIVRGEAHDPRLGAISSAWLGVPERTILFQTSVLTLIAAMAGPTLMLFVDSPDGAVVSVRDVIWLPALLFLLDLARWALLTASDAAVETPREPEAPAAVDLFLHDTVTRLRRALGKEIKTFVELPADETRTPVPHDSIEAMEAGTGLMISETLGVRHFALIAKTVNEQVLDRGHTVLIICPEEHLDQTESLFYELLGSGPRNGSRPRIWRLGQDGERPEGLIDVLLVSQFSLEVLASNIENYENELRLLGGVVALNLHETDFGVLDIALDRIKGAIPPPSKLVGVFQSEPRKDMETRIGNFTITRGNSIEHASTNRFERSIPQWLLIVNTDGTATFDDTAKLPVGFRAAIETYDPDHNVHPFVHGASATYADLNWKRVTRNRLHNDSAELISHLRAITQTTLLPARVPHSVSIVDDPGNLADAVGITSSTPVALEAIKIVARGNYPVAPFLTARLQAELKSKATSKDKRDALDEFRTKYGSIAPEQRQGPRELATKVRMTFRAEAKATAAAAGLNQINGLLKLSQNKVAAFLDRPDRALRQLRVNTSRGGMQRLFRSAFRLKPGQSVVAVRPADATDQAGGEGRLRIKNFVLSGPPAEDEEAVPALSVLDFADHHLPFADHGLSYAQNTRIWLGQKILRVQQINMDTRTVYCQVLNDHPLKPTLFVRDYALQFTDTERRSFAVERYTEELSSKQPYEIITGFIDCAARTRRAYEFGTVAQPFGEKNLRPERIETSALSHAQMRSGTLLRILAGTDANGGAQTRKRRGPGQAFRKTQTTGQFTPEIAFTLAMTLQDVLAVQFPNHAHRLAVICPEASGVDMTTAGTLDSFTYDRLRHLTSLNDSGLPVDRVDATAVPTELADRFEQFSRDFSALARMENKVETAPHAAGLSLLLIEDSDHDLGVAQSFYIHRDRIFGIWRDFLIHCENSKSKPQETGYDFGSGSVSTLLDFAGARAVVEALCDTKR